MGRIMNIIHFFEVGFYSTYKHFLNTTSHFPFGLSNIAIPDDQGSQYPICALSNFLLRII